MKKSFFILAILFVCGVISADICTEILKEGNKLFNLDMYKTYANAELVYRDIFWNILYERIKLFGFLLLLCFTPIRRYIGAIVICLFSFIWGFYIMICIVELGLAGVVVGIACVLPHGLLYGIMLTMIFAKNEIRTYSYQSKGTIGRNIVDIFSVLLLFITGCVLESIVSTHFIPWLIRLSMI